MAVGKYALTTLAHANTELGLTADGGVVDARIEGLIDKATATIESALNRKIMVRLYSKERYDGKRQDELYLEQYPVLAVNLDNLVWDSVGKTLTRNDGGSFVTDGFADGNEILVQNSDKNSGLLTASGVVTQHVITFDEVIVSDTDDDNVIISRFRALWVGDTEIPVNNYEVNSNYIYYSGGFASGNKNVRATYYAGYDTIPQDIEQKCLELVKMFYIKKSSIKKESLGKHAIEFYQDKDGIEDEIRESLSMYIKWTI